MPEIDILVTMATDFSNSRLSLGTILTFLRTDTGGLASICIFF